MDKIISRIEARERGLTRYYTGKPCKHGHISSRFSSSCTCVLCFNIAQRKKLRKSNAERKRKYRQKYVNKARVKNAEYGKLHRLRHPDKSRARVSNRRARGRNAEGIYTGDDIKFMMESQGSVCNSSWCNASLLNNKYHVDHKLPLSRGGSNWPINLQLLCPSCNDRKGVLTAEEWEVKNAA